MAFSHIGDFAHAQGGASSIGPQASGAQASFGLTGTGVDMLTTEGIVSAWVSAGGTSGAPTNWTVTAKLQESSDNSTFTDMTNGALPVIGPITSSSAISDVYVSAITRGKRYVRIVATVAFTAGTTPTVGVFGGVVAQKKILGTGAGQSLALTTA
jgi:hypothetical protein